MDECFAAMPVTNATIICVDGITTREVQQANDDGVDVDGRGYYLFLANEAEPKQPIQILAKFVSEIEAGRFVKLLTTRTAA
jgi:hypothetical protein